MPQRDREAAAIASDRTAAILTTAGFWPVGLRAPGTNENWRAVFSPCDKHPDDKTAGR
jgi:hypothetical protein